MYLSGEEFEEEVLERWETRDTIELTIKHHPLPAHLFEWFVAIILH